MEITSRLDVLKLNMLTTGIRDDYAIDEKNGNFEFYPKSTIETHYKLVQILQLMGEYPYCEIREKVVVILVRKENLTKRYDEK